MTNTPMNDRPLVLGGVTLCSRLILGTGKYATNDEMVAALLASGTDCVTVAVRRVDLGGGEGPDLLAAIDRERYHVLPNTAGCFDAESAVRTARLARDVLETNLIKLEVLGDKRTLLPDPIGTLKAAETLVKDGFKVLVYTSDDARLAVRLEEVGVTSVMPAGSPIGSGQGILNPNALRILMELVSVPVIIDAGVGTASDVAVAMELGADGVLLNSGIALARDPLRMARAMGAACRAGRDAWLAGRIPKKLYANASSPTTGTIEGAGDGADAQPTDAPPTTAAAGV
jgi:thiazole synthase